MKKTSNHEEYEQLTIDFGDDVAPVEVTEEDDEPKKKRAKGREGEIGAEITVNPEVKLFCDGCGIPDYARKAYIKRINFDNNTVLIESAPNGKEYGLLFMSDVTLA